MIRKLLATTAVATLVATGAMAQAPAPSAPGGQMTSEPATPLVKKAEGHLATNLIGESVYNGTGDDAQNIGTVNDLVIDTENRIQAIVIGVGGFLGIGQKDVALEFSLVDWAERDGDQFLVVDTNADALRALPEFDRDAYEPQPADADVSEVKPATKEDLANAPAPAEGQNNAATESSGAPANNSMAQAPTTPAPTPPAAAPGTTPPAAAPGTTTDNTQTSAVDRSTLTERPIDQIKAEEFVGTTVYGAGDENVGEIGDVVMSTDNSKVDAVIIDVGGFLGLGEKPIAVAMEDLTFMADADGDLYLYTPFTKEQLEAHPAYDEATFAQNRDQMLLRVQ